MPLPQSLEKAFDSANRGAKELIDALWESRKGAGREVPIDEFTAIIELVDVATGKLDAATKLAEIYMDPPANPNPGNPGNPAPRRERRARRSELHSIIFPKDEWTPVTARAWLRDHSKKFGKMEVVGSSYHFPQFETERPVIGTVVIKHSPRIMATVQRRADS